MQITADRTLRDDFHVKTQLDVQIVYDKITIKTSENAHTMHHVGQRYT